ncbi:cardiolipin synthase [Tenacibaculum tangerinum]|uniref:Cardiolipin synthase n=1 Tax=Tenacibaculum tangerinum TaxID=3038772 RepID=A0ABY8L1Y8_9FLAO|nr:cardiolipin synthase [Tenacibaculum tangerinum]WGH75121.1 cardiolipin synthase [Tenacibaculum tangerinum]
MITTLLAILYIAVIATVAIIIVNTSTASKSIAYLFLLFLFPVVGIIIYFSIGMNYRTHKLYNKKLSVDKNFFAKLKEQVQSYAEKTLSESKKNLAHFYNLTKYVHLENFLTGDNEVSLLLNGENKFQEVIKALKAAKNHIHIEYYIFQNDDIGKKIGEILKEKATEGVDVRFIYDDYGSKNIRKSFVESLKNSGVEAFPFYKIKWLLFANRINYRNHRKIIIVDGKVGFVGGINVSDRYSNPNKFNRYWRDTHVKIEGPAVLSLQRVFLADWNFCANQNMILEEKFFPLIEEKDEKTNEENQLVQIIASGPDSDHPDIMYALIQAILLSKKEILITTPYFVPRTSFLDAIKIARLSGVDIKLLVPDVSDSKLVNAVSHSFYKEILEVGVEIYKYEKGFIHAKTMVFDGFVSTVGTANLDERSFDLNFEINAFIYNKKFAAKLKEAFLEDVKNSKKIVLEEWNSRSIITRFIEKAARLLAPIL